jgi:hypothetical protein
MENRYMNQGLKCPIPISIARFSCYPKFKSNPLKEEIK